MKCLKHLAQFPACDKNSRLYLPHYLINITSLLVCSPPTRLYMYVLRAGILFYCVTSSAPIRELGVNTFLLSE